MIHASIKTYIRLHLVDMMLKGLAPFSSFRIEGDNFDHVLAAYAFSKIETALREDSDTIISAGALFERLGGTEESRLNYYYEFMEQLTQMVVDQVDSGDLSMDDLPDSVQESVKNIQKQIKKWVEPVPYGLDNTDPRISALITICLTAPAYASFIPIVGIQLLL